MCHSGYHKIQWIHYNAQYTSMKCWRQRVPSCDTVTITPCDQFRNLFININMLHVRKLTDIVFLCTRTKYNNLSFLENPSCVKITHATFIILKSFSVQYFSQKSWTSVIFNVWQCPLFLLTWRFLLESK